MKAVVFDMDGVIFDSERLSKEVWLEIAKERGIEGFSPVYDQIIGVSKSGGKQIVCDAYGADLPFDEIHAEAAMRKITKCPEGHYPLKEGIVELLIFLKEQGYKVGLASSTEEAVVRMHLENSGLISYFDCLICGNMVAHSKPDPEIFLVACETLGVAPEETYIIEDSYNGIRAAARAGAFPIMVPDLKEPTEEMRSLAKLILKDLYEVKKYIKDKG